MASERRQTTKLESDGSRTPIERPRPDVQYIGLAEIIQYIYKLEGRLKTLEERVGALESKGRVYPGEVDGKSVTR